MPRIIEVTVPSSKSSGLVKDIENNIQGVSSLRVLKKVSLKPQGDVISIEITSKTMPDLMRLLAERDIGKTSTTTLTSSEPLSIISKSSDDAIRDDSNESSWEEADQMITQESNATLNMLIIMFVAGAIAAFGIATNAVHVVIGAMIIAPAFEPIMRIPLGIVSNHRALGKALLTCLKMYAALVLGAIVATLTTHYALGSSDFGSTSSYLESHELIRYWSSISLTSILISLCASIAGVLLVLTNRSVLTMGAMIALALIPATALFGAAIVQLDVPLLLSSGLRWLVDVALITISGFVILYCKKAFVHRRDMLPPSN